jgi:hypothetical protein
MTYIHSGYRAVQYTSLGMGLTLLVAYALEYATLRSIVRAKPGKSAPNLDRWPACSPSRLSAPTRHKTAWPCAASRNELNTSRHFSSKRTNLRGRHVAVVTVG